MTAEPATPRRGLTGLPPRRPVDTDPTVSRLRRDHRQPAPTAAPAAVPPPPDPRPGERPDGAGDTDRDEALPRYLRLTRKEARIREDQADRLAAEVRRLNQARKHRTGPVGERITDNTLIRVALDLLLADTARLSGTTEDELRNSVSP